MRYIEVTVNTPPELIDLRCNEMADMGAGGFVIENEEDLKAFLEQNRQYWDYVDKELEESYKGLSRIKCYLTEDSEGQEILDRIQAAYPEQVSTAMIQDSDWENNWRSYYKPIEVGEKLVVVPEWEPVPDDGRLALRLDPGLIFGTGSHPTTKLCLAALERCVRPGCKVLDLGCGSGILGIGALLLGAGSCLGVDIDPKAPQVVLDNGSLNCLGADRLQARAGDIIGDESLRRAIGGGYDLVLANIVADVVIPLSALVRPFMTKDGIFVCSGIIEDRWVETEAALLANGFEILDHKSDEEWHYFMCR